MAQGTPGCPTTTGKEPRFIKFWLKVRNHRCWFRQQGRPAVDSEVVAEILMNIAYKDHYRYLVRGTRGRVRVFERRGQWVFSEREYAHELGWSRGRLRRFLDDYSTGDPDDAENGPEIHLKRDQLGTRLTWLKKADWPDAPTTDDTTSGTTDGPLTAHSRPTLYIPEGVEGVDSTTTPRGLVDNSVDNPSMPRKVAEVVEAFQQASGVIRPPSAREKIRVEKAITQNADAHVPIREFVRQCITKAKAAGAAPTSVCYAIAAWENERLERESASRRPATCRESQDRPIRPGYHATASPLPRRELSDEQSKGAAESIGGILSKLGLPSTGGKK